MQNTMEILESVSASPRNPKRVLSFGFSILTFVIGVIGVYFYYTASAFGSKNNKCDLVLTWTDDNCFAANGQLCSSNQQNAPSRSHCLIKYPGKSNSFYDQKNACGFLPDPIRILVLDVNRTHNYKTPPVVACLDQSKKSARGNLTAANWPSSFLNTVTLKLVRCNNDFKQIALEPNRFCKKNCKKISFDVSYKQSDPSKSFELKTNINQIDTISTVIYHEPSPCTVIVHFKRKMYWSDNKRGTIDVLDLDTNSRITLVKDLIAPGSMSVDPDREYLFWCSGGSEGSIGRADLNGNRRTDLTRRKYNMSHPSGLVVDQYNRRLYWNANGLVHVSDYDGNGHKIVWDQTTFKTFDSDCIPLLDAQEHIVFWDKKRPVSSNHLLLVTHVAQNDTLFRDPVNDCNQKEDNRKWACLKNTRGYHCICLNRTYCPLNVSDYFIINTLNSIGYLPLRPKHPFDSDAHVLDTIGCTTFDLNSKTQKIFYYDNTLKQIRTKNMTSKAKISSTMIKNITLPASNGLAYDWMTNNVYFIDSVERNIKIIGLNHYNPGIIIKAMENSTVDALVINPLKNLLFFVCRNRETKTIFKSELNGAGVSKVTDMAKGSSSDFFTIDPTKNTIYWLNVEENSIEKFDVDGNRHQTFSPPEMYSFIMKLGYIFFGVILTGYPFGPSMKNIVSYTNLNKEMLVTGVLRSSVNCT